MPRGKRRTQNYPDEDRHVPSKRLRATTTNVSTTLSTSTGSAYAALVHSHHQQIHQPPPPPPQQQHSSRRSRSDDHFSQKKCLTWFRQYTSLSEPDMLGPEGMERFCEDLEVEPENIVMLVLAYKMGAANMGYFKQSEWLHGLTALECDSLTKLKRKLGNLNGLLNEANAFKSIYRYAYDFAKDSDQRSMDVNTAKAMLELLLGKQWVLHQQFAQFLEQSKYKVINKDQWCNILEFSRIINTDLTNYDIDGAWPVMLDEFVEWLRVKSETPTSANDAKNHNPGRHAGSS